jgi:FMN phosphatase YigB (HAD superfamily)
VFVSASLLTSFSSCAHFFEHIVMVEEIRRHKQTLEVYETLAQKVGKNKEEIKEILLVSESPVNVVRAGAIGIQAVWVDREENSFR